MCPTSKTQIDRPGMREIARAVSMLLAETDKRLAAAVDEVIEQANDCFVKVEAELNDKIGQIAALKAELQELREAFKKLCAALKDEETEHEGNKEGTAAGNGDNSKA